SEPFLVEEVSRLGDGLLDSSSQASSAGIVARLAVGFGAALSGTGETAVASTITASIGTISASIGSTDLALTLEGAISTGISGVNNASHWEQRTVFPVTF